MAADWTLQASYDPAKRGRRAAEDTQSVEIQQNVPLNLTGLEFEWAANQGSISCIAIFAQATDKNKDFVFIGLAVSLSCCQLDKVCGGWFYL